MANYKKPTGFDPTIINLVPTIKNFFGHPKMDKNGTEIPAGSAAMRAFLDETKQLTEEDKIDLCGEIAFYDPAKLVYQPGKAPEKS